ncbi:MAG: hypothetical protein MUF11_04330 [Beijerinckiaceae bacterium]|jgi:hypothetical protein|nr:hypothetical protein [Beijerinckiaceae bacterium]
MRHLRPALLLGILSAALVALWLQQHREIWSERTYLLVLVWFLGGFLGAMGTSLVMWLMAWLGLARTAQAFRAIAFVPAFLVAGGFAFLIQNRIQVEGYELHPERPFRSFFWQSLEGVAVFIYSAPHYLLPWMAPVMAIAGYALLPSPRNRAKG